MAVPPDSQRVAATAWAASLALHLSLSATVVWLAGVGRGQGAAEAPAREVGIVLRESSERPKPFDEESEDPAEAPEASVAPVSDSPPEAADQPPSEASDPAPPGAFTGLLADLVADPVPGAGRPTGGGGGGAPAASGRPLPTGATRVTVFGVEGVGNKFVYAFDRSISMRGAPLRAAKRQLIESLASLGPTHQFHVLFFNMSVLQFDLTGGQRRIAFATDAEKRRATRFVAGVTADGGTLRDNALRKALQHRPDVVFFLTDAEDPMTPGDVATVIDRATRSGVTIHAIEFGVGRWRGGRNFLVELAEATGGQHAYVDVEYLGSRQ